MHFYQAMHTLIMGNVKQVLELFIVENSADEQYGIRTPCSCLVDLVLIYNEIFSQHRNAHHFFNCPQVLQ